MENRLLLINKRPEVVDDFLKAFQDAKFQIDVAYSGMDGLKKLQAQQYKLVITGMLMPDVDGGKILAYIQKYCPKTFAIVYTTRISVGQVAYLTNKLHVYKIFLRPMDYDKVMREAIEEAFERYDLMEMRAVEEVTLKKQVKAMGEEYLQVREQVLTPEAEDKVLQRMTYAIFAHFLSLKSELTELERAQLMKVETKAIKRYLTEINGPQINLMAYEIKLRHRFVEGHEGRSLGVHIDSNVMQLSVPLMESIYMCLYCLTYRVAAVAENFDAHIYLNFENRERIPVTLQFQFARTEQQKEISPRLEAAMETIIEQCVQAMCSSFRKSSEDHLLRYECIFDISEESIFK